MCMVVGSDGFSCGPVVDSGSLSSGSRHVKLAATLGVKG